MRASSKGNDSAPRNRSVRTRIPEATSPATCPRRVSTASETPPELPELPSRATQRVISLTSIRSFTVGRTTGGPRRPMRCFRAARQSTADMRWVVDHRPPRPTANCQQPIDCKQHRRRRRRRRYRRLRGLRARGRVDLCGSTPLAGRSRPGPAELMEALCRNIISSHGR